MTGRRRRENKVGGEDQDDVFSTWGANAAKMELFVIEVAGRCFCVFVRLELGWALGMFRWPMGTGLVLINHVGLFMTDSERERHVRRVGN